MRFSGTMMRAYCVRVLRRISDALRVGPHPTIDDTGARDQGDDATAARRRFWAEFREGQREADAHNTRSR
jgi:hypothetical protein